MIDRTEPGVLASDRAAIERLRASGRRRRIKFLPDFGRYWPFWEDDEENDVLNISTSPDDYQLSDDLTARIREWFDFWAAHYDPDALWDSSSNYHEWYQTGLRLADALRHEVQEFADVTYLG